ncbi:MAG: transporter [Bacteroidetes bacterium]|nr:MAG: transporter [Bacteroidota bacterium]PTM14694.1 MAG: transporter [Bacteroidota bacterium]
MKCLCTALLVVLSCYAKLWAQTPSDAIMMEARQACLLLDYNQGSFDQYWEGTLLRENQTIATVKRNAVMPMVAVGILDKLNFYVGAPFIKTESSEPNGGKFAGASGFQDLLVALKYRIINKVTDKGTFSVLATVGFSTPVTNYLPDYMPYSLGLGAPELSYRAIAQYKWKSGLYLRGAGAYLWRGYSEAEREYYYNNGSYYTPWMDVPNAITIEGIVGFWLWNNSIQLELNYLGSKSTSGDDIRPYNAAQPTNDIEMDRVGLLAHYYFSKIKGLGVVAYHNRVINGRNTAKINTTGVGVTYFFNYLKKQN